MRSDDSAQGILQLVRKRVCTAGPRSDPHEELVTAHALIESRYEDEWAEYRGSLPERAAAGHTEEELKSRWLVDNARRISRAVLPRRGDFVDAGRSERSHARDRCARSSASLPGAPGKRSRDTRQRATVSSAILLRGPLPEEHPQVNTRMTLMQQVVSHWGMDELGAARAAVETTRAAPASLDDVHQLIAGVPPALLRAAGLLTWSRRVLDLIEDPGCSACGAYVKVISMVLETANDCSR